MNEQQHQARLAREATDIHLGTITVAEPVINVAKVEVTYAFGDPWNRDYTEHAGHFIVRMPENVDPWETAADKAIEALAQRHPEATYTSVDDVFAV